MARDGGSGDPAPTSFSERKSDPGRVVGLREPLVVWAITIALCGVLGRLTFVPVLNQHLGTLIAALFLYVPATVLSRRREDFRRFGLTIHPVRKALTYFIGTSAVVFPLYAGGFFAYYRKVCALAIKRRYGLDRIYYRLCTPFNSNLKAVSLTFPKNVGQLALGQLVVGISEEYFFRGYLQTRLEDVWPNRHDVLGLTRAILVASLLFAVGHLAVDLNPFRLAVFFPSLLFGWLRRHSGSIAAGALFHACCNLLNATLYATFFGP